MVVESRDRVQNKSPLEDSIYLGKFSQPQTLALRRAWEMEPDRARDIQGTLKDKQRHSS